MFDWARGSTLKKMISVGIIGATFDPWLKGWAQAWPLALLKIPPGSRVLDVGSGNNPWYAQNFANKGCEAHVLEKKLIRRKGVRNWGISKKTINKHPDLTFHLGLAGQNKGPRRYFDLITCISVIEHTYDSDFVMDAKKPLRHFGVLADMIRMLKPGGILAITYDFFLSDMPHWRGWDYLADIALLHHCGIELLNPQATLRSRTYIYNHEDTLFMAPKGILSFADEYMRSTSIGIMFKKPGPASKVTLSPHPKLHDILLGNSTDLEEKLSSNQLRQILISKSQRAVKNYIKKIKAAI